MIGWCLISPARNAFFLRFWLTVIAVNFELLAAGPVFKSKKRKKSNKL
jgi:hypothetical protein